MRLVLPRSLGLVLVRWSRLAAGFQLALEGSYIGGFPRSEPAMPKFVIERDIPGAGKLSPSELQAISQKSCSVLRNLGPQIQWVQSYVTDDKIYCVYVAPNEDLIRQHAQQGGFPANRISAVRAVIDPTTAE
jgi:Nickel responsive protein SCO4226-like